LGTIGGEQSLKYTTLGDSVNTAARLESFDKGSTHAGDRETCRILISEDTQRRLRGAFRTVDLGPHQLRGKQEAVRIFRVLGPREPGAAIEESGGDES
jgi:adenylate cyclase